MADPYEYRIQDLDHPNVSVDELIMDWATVSVAARNWRKSHTSCRIVIQRRKIEHWEYTDA